MTESGKNRSSLLPILSALAVLAVALAAFWVLRLMPGDDQPDDTRVGLAAVGHNDASSEGITPTSAPSPVSRSRAPNPASSAINGSP